MRKKLKTLIFILSCIILTTWLCYFVMGNPFIFFYNQRLKSAIGTLGNGEIVSLNAIIPFEWNVLYMPEPYQSKAEIEEIIGFKSIDIQENERKHNSCKCLSDITVHKNKVADAPAHHKKMEDLM